MQMINVFASNSIDKYENRPGKLHSVCLEDFLSSYIIKKTHGVPIEFDEIKNYIIPVSNIDDVKPNLNLIVLKNEFGEMRKCSQPCIIRFQKQYKLKIPEEHYLRFVQLQMPWRDENELKQDNQSYEDRYKEVDTDILSNIKKHELYMDVDFEELQNFDFIKSDDKEDNAKFSMINKS